MKAAYLMCVEGSLQTSSQAEPPSLCLWKSSQEPQEAGTAMTLILHMGRLRLGKWGDSPMSLSQEVAELEFESI